MISAFSRRWWENDVRVEVKNQQIQWSKDNIPITDPQNAQEMINHIVRILKFKTNIYGENGTPEELIALLYNKPLEFKIQFVRIEVCGCNMGNLGNCDTVRNIYFEEKKIETYGDALEIISLDYVGSSEFYDWDTREFMYPNPQSLFDSLKKYNIKVDIQQIIKHMYRHPSPSKALAIYLKTRDNNFNPKQIFTYPHYYDYYENRILFIKIIKELPLVYDSPHHNPVMRPDFVDKGKKLNVQLDPNIIYVSYRWS